MNQSVKNVKNGLKTDPLLVLEVVASNNPYVFNMNIKKYLGIIVDQKNVPAMVQAVLDGIENLSPIQVQETVTKLLDVPVIESNLTEVGKEAIADELMQLKSSSDDEGDDNEGSSTGWATVLGAAIPGIVTLLIAKPWQNQPMNDTAPTVQSNNNMLIFVGIGAVIAVVILVIVLSKQN